MAVAIEGFSIREYASKMRSVNVEKSWPFHKETMTKEELAAKLPLIKCPKYRWWKDELQAMRSKSSNEKEKSISGEGSGFVSEKSEAVLVTEEEEKLLMSCPVCRSFTATTVNAVNAHIDGCLAQTTSSKEKSTEEPAVTTKVKSRARKSRSIMEIFAASPQIETVKLDYDNRQVIFPEEEVDLKVLKKKASSDLVGKKKKKKKKREKNTNRLRDDVPMMTLKLKNMKNKKKKKTKKIDGGFVAPSSRTIGTAAPPSDVMKKEKIHKFKVLPPLDFCGQEKISLHGKCSRKEIPDNSPLRKKKSSRMQNLSTQKKLKVMRTSKFTVRQQKQEPFPVHSILKSCAEATYSQNNSAISSFQGGGQTNSCHVEQSEKLARFSRYDGIHGPTKIQYSSGESPQLQNLSKEFSDVITSLSMRDSLESEKDLPATGMDLDMDGSSDDISTGIANETSSRLALENICLDGVRSHVSTMAIPSPENTSCQDKEETCTDRSVDLNQVSNDDLLLFHQGNSNESQTLSSASTPKLESTLTESFKPTSETQADRSVQRVPNTGGNLAEPAATTSLENANASLQPLRSCLAMSAETNGRNQFLSQASQEAFKGHDLFYQSVHHMSSKELRTNIYSSVEWKKQRESVYSDRCVVNNFIGLPLNSQGEFIESHSGGKRGFNLVKPSAKMGSASDFQLLNLVQPNSPSGYLSMKDTNYAEAALQSDKFKVFPRENHQQGNSELPLSSKVGVREMPMAGRAEVHWQDLVKRNSHSVNRLVSDIHVTDLSSQSCRQYDQIQIQNEKEKIQPEKNLDCMFPHATQPTMRLMGKDVTVGINNKDVQGFEDGRTCTDNLIQHHLTTTVSDEPSLKRQIRQERIVLPYSGKPKETITPLEAQSNPSLGSTFPMKVADPRSAYMNLNWQMHARQQNSLPLIRENASAKLHSFLHPLPFHALLNNTSNCQPPCNSGTESLKMSSHVPVAASSSFGASQHMVLSSAQLNCSQRLPHGIESAFHSPFLNQECRGNVQPSGSESSSQRLPQWLLNAKQHKAGNLTSSQPYSGASADQPCIISGTNFSATPTYNTSMVAYPHHASTFRPHNQSPAPCFHPPLIPALRGCKPTVINASHRNMSEDKDGEKSKYFHLMVHDSVKTAKKRPADEADNSTKAMKKPNLGMHRDPTAVNELNRRINVSSYAQFTGAADFDAFRDKSMDLGHSLLEIRKTGCRDSSDITGYEKCNSGAADFDAFKDKSMDLGHSLLEIRKTGCRDSSDINGYEKCNSGAADFDAFRNKPRGLGHSLPEIQNPGFRDSSCLKSFKQNGVIRGGPIKLSAGAKHILKPSQSMDHDQPRPIHSTISFGADTNSDKISELQKSAQIYRF